MSGRTEQRNSLLAWWVSTLFNTLPAGLASWLRGLRYRHDYRLEIQRGELQVQDRKGRLIERFMLAAEPSLDLNLGEDVSDLQGSTVVPISRMRGRNGEAASGHTLAATGEETEATLVEAAAQRDEVTLLLDGEGTAHTEAIEKTQLFFCDEGRIRPVESGSQGDAGAALAIETPLDVDLGVELKDSQSEAESWVTHVQKYMKKGRCLLLLPQAKVLSLRMVYPAEVEGRVEHVLEHDLERHMPMDIHEIRYFHAMEKNEAGSRVTVDVEVMKKEDFEAFEAALGRMTDRGLLVSTRQLFDRHRKLVDLSTGRFSRGAQRILLNGWPWLINAAAALVLLMLPFAYLEWVDVGVNTVTQQEMNRATEIQAMKRSLESRMRINKALMEELSGVRRITPLLADLSEQLDDQSWLHELNYEGDQLRIKGEAESASRVSDDLYRMGLFEEIRFVSSIVNNAMSGKEAFEIAMKVHDVR